MNLIIVVFPVPGPPVIIHTLFSFTASIASFCFLDKNIFEASSIILNLLLKFLIFFILSALFRAINLSAMNFSAK